MKKKPRVTKEDNIGELVTKYPQVIEILLDYGLHCAMCPLSSADTIEHGAKLHGLETEEIKELVDRINEALKHGE
jgi:hybrid cluster-associated redox disulfide protein